MLASYKSQSIPFFYLYFTGEKWGQSSLVKDVVLVSGRAGIWTQASGMADSVESPLEGVLEDRLGPHTQSLSCESLRCSLRTCISNTFPGEAASWDLLWEPIPPSSPMAEFSLFILWAHLQKETCLQKGLPPNWEKLDFGLKMSAFLDNLIENRLNQFIFKRLMMGLEKKEFVPTLPRVLPWFLRNHTFLVPSCVIAWPLRGPELWCPLRGPALLCLFWSRLDLKGSSGPGYQGPAGQGGTLGFTLRSFQVTQSGGCHVDSRWHGHMWKKSGSPIKGVLCWSKWGLRVVWTRRQWSRWWGVMRCWVEPLGGAHGSAVWWWVGCGVRASWASSGRRDSNTRLRGLAFPLKAIGFQTFYA